MLDIDAPQGDFLTRNFLMSELLYDPLTGAFSWLVSRPGITAGNIAGHHLKNSTGKTYCVICIKRKRFMAHRLAWLFMKGSWPPHEIDHINGDGVDNRWINLRSVTSSENKMNARKREDNKSGITGVIWNTETNRWKSYIGINGKHNHLCYSKDFFEACCARKSAENQYGFHPNHGSSRPL